MSVSASSAETPLMMSEKYGSEKSRVSASGTTSAMESVREVTRVRAARLGT